MERKGVVETGETRKRRKRNPLQNNANRARHSETDISREPTKTTGNGNIRILNKIQAGGIGDNNSEQVVRIEKETYNARPTTRWGVYVFAIETTEIIGAGW